MESTQISGSTIMEKRKQSDDPAPAVKKQKAALTPQVQARVDAIRKACPHLFLTPADVGVAFIIHAWPFTRDCATYEGIDTEFAEALVRKTALKHDGNTDATYGDGSKYIANFLSPEQAQTSYQLVCKEIGVDPGTGVPLAETLLNPQDSREYFNRFQKNTDGTNWFPMPHVTGHFGSGKVGMIGSQSRNSSIRDHPEKIKRRVPFAEVPEINRLRRQVEEYLGKGDGWIRRANMNVYKDGTSRLGAHRDGVHEGEFTVHTLSLGAGRHYLVECTASGAKTHIVLKGGSLNLLNSTTNETHTHSMVSQKGSCKPRISINFRR